MTICLRKGVDVAKKGKKPDGRPTDYREEFDRMAYVACVEGGFTDLKLSKLFNVCKATINNWKKAHPTFLDSIKSGKDEWDCAVAEKCLMKRVTGYRYTETTRELYPTWVNQPAFAEDGTPLYEADGVTQKMESVKGDPILIVTKKVSKQVAPDTRAIEMHLTNRNPERWRRIKQVEVTGKNGGPMQHTVNPWETIVKEVTGKNNNEIPSRPDDSD